MSNAILRTRDLESRVPKSAPPELESWLALSNYDAAIDANKLPRLCTKNATNINKK